MNAKNRGLSGLLDRRITLKKPTAFRDANNEPDTVLAVVISNLPAYKKEEGSSDKEGLEGNALRAEVELEWQIRWFGQVPKAKWVLIDEYGTTHEVVGIPTEIGRRVGWNIKTRQLQ